MKAQSSYIAIIFAFIVPILSVGFENENCSERSRKTCNSSTFVGDNTPSLLTLVENIESSTSVLRSIKNTKPLTFLTNWARGDKLVNGIQPRGKQKGSMMMQFLPMLAIPFLMSSMMAPKMILSLIFMMVQAFMTGKIAIILGLINMFRNRGSGGGVYSHNIELSHPQKEIMAAHYGHSGGNYEYGSYVNSWKRRRKREHLHG